MTRVGQGRVGPEAILAITAFIQDGERGDIIQQTHSLHKFPVREPNKSHQNRGVMVYQHLDDILTGGDSSGKVWRRCNHIPAHLEGKGVSIPEGE